MPNTRSAAKRARQSIKRAIRREAFEKELKKARVEFQRSLHKHKTDREAILKAQRKYVSKLDKSRKLGITHRNRVSIEKSRVQLLVNYVFVAIAEPTGPRREYQEKWEKYAKRLVPALRATSEPLPSEKVKFSLKCEFHTDIENQPSFELWEKSDKLTLVLSASEGVKMVDIEIDSNEMSAVDYSERPEDGVSDSLAYTFYYDAKRSERHLVSGKCRLLNPIKEEEVLVTAYLYDPVGEPRSICCIYSGDHEYGELHTRV